jgi:hypothetical protein
MEFQDFVRKCVLLFREAKQKKVISPRVTRGRAASCSSACEDLIALAISEMIPNGYQLLVDYPMTVRHGNGQGAKTAYPDVTVLCNRTLAGVIEIKVDLVISRKTGRSEVAPGSTNCRKQHRLPTKQTSEQSTMK